MRRSKDDEKLLDSLLTSGKKGFIIDTRTQNVAQLSRTRGDTFFHSYTNTALTVHDVALGCYADCLERWAKVFMFVV